jgi:FkbM family methyltransferase
MKKLIKNLFQKTGFRIVNNNSNDLVKNIPIPLNSFFSMIKEFNFEPKHIVDVGANHGKWTRNALKFFPNAQITMVEPQHWLKDSISDVLNANKNVKLFPYGAGEKEGTFNFTIMDIDVSSSFKYSEEEAKEKGYKQIQLPIITINKLLADNNLPVPDILKIDAEGIDIQVLKGASDYIGKTEIILIEAGVVNKSFDNSFLKTINYMDEKGYRLYDITELNRPYFPRVLWLVELVFVLKDGIIDSKVIANS